MLEKRVSTLSPQTPNLGHIKLEVSPGGSGGHLSSALMHLDR